MGLFFISTPKAPGIKCILCNYMALWFKLPTQLNTVLLQKLIAVQLFRKLPAFHGIRTFVTVFTKFHQWTLS